MPSEIDPERLRELYVDEDLSVREIADAVDETRHTVREQLEDTDYYQPKFATVVSRLDPEDVGESVEPPEPDRRRFGGGGRA